MVADSASFSPSAAKPAQVVAAWQRRTLAIELVEPVPVTVEQLARAHDRDHVEQILACRAPNGFGNTSPEVAATLVHTSGDYDMHYGDGTDDIIEQTSATFVVHFTAGEHYRDPGHASRLLAELPRCVHAMAGCDIVLYQAGADQHVDDPLGGVLTTDELQRRDEIVFGELAALGIPVAWNLAGGYQVEPDGSIPRVLEIHENTARAAIAAAPAWRHGDPA